MKAVIKWPRQILPKCYQVLNQRVQRLLGRKAPAPKSFYRQNPPLDSNYSSLNDKTWNDEPYKSFLLCKTHL